MRGRKRQVEKDEKGEKTGKEKEEKEGDRGKIEYCNKY